MVRAPCCDKIGLNKGSWSEEEDQILLNHVQRYGHSNWRALPKQAGLLRCGKSCRLRWMNYLRPDIKRGNFNEEEEDMIISLHEQLGNRWSQIAAKLPGRTDNEIKNVWHTHLKKRLNGLNLSKELKQNSSTNQPNLNGLKSNAMIVQTTPLNLSLADVNISRELSDTASSTSSNVISDSSNYSSIYQEKVEMDANLWTDASSVENSVTDNLTCTSLNEDLNFWYRLFMKAGEMQDFAEL